MQKKPNEQKQPSDVAKYQDFVEFMDVLVRHAGSADRDVRTAAITSFSAYAQVAAMGNIPELRAAITPAMIKRMTLEAPAARQKAQRALRTSLAILLAATPNYTNYTKVDPRSMSPRRDQKLGAAQATVA